MQNPINLYLFGEKASGLKKQVAGIFFLLCVVNSMSQESDFKLQVTPVGPLPFSIKKIQNKKFPDSLSLQKGLKQMLTWVHRKGYLTASADSIVFRQAGAEVFLTVGGKYTWVKLSIDCIDELASRKIRVNRNIFENKPLNYYVFQKTREKIIRYYEKTGYPFVSVQLQQVKISDGRIEGLLQVTKNQPVVISDVVIKGGSKISDTYYKYYTGLSPGNPYNEDIIRNIGKRVQEIIFVDEIKPAEIEFSNNKATVYAYLENRKANYVSGILGFMPDNRINKKLVLTGDVNLFLINSFRKGESISFNWKKLELASQEMDIRMVYPYLLSLPLALDAGFDLFKKDSTYLTLHTSLGVRYLFPGENYLKIYIDHKKTSIISNYGMESLTALPSYADIKMNMLGLEYRFRNVDYIYNPRRGIDLIVHAETGERQIFKHPKIPDTAYEDIDMKTTQLESSCNIAFYQSVMDKMVIKFQNKSGYLSNPNLFDNELFRLGGLKTIRGFDEHAILASSYTIFTLEYRYLFEQNSNAYLFFDGAYYEQRRQPNFVSDTPVGFGAGVNFETRAGIFSLNYAIGKQFNNPLQLRSAKIHFGFVTRF